jgi:hypothetical protein
MRPDSTDKSSRAVASPHPFEIYFVRRATRIAMKTCSLDAGAPCIQMSTPREEKTFAIFTMRPLRDV